MNKPEKYLLVKKEIVGSQESINNNGRTIINDEIIHEYLKIKEENTNPKEIYSLESFYFHSVKKGLTTIVKSTYKNNNRYEKDLKTYEEWLNKLEETK